MSHDDRQAILARAAANPVVAALERVRAAVRPLFPHAPAQIDTAIEAAGDFQAELLNRVQASAGTTIGAVASSFEERFAAHEARCAERHQAVMDALLSLSDRIEERLRTLEAGQ